MAAQPACDRLETGPEKAKRSANMKKKTLILAGVSPKISTPYLEKFNIPSTYPTPPY